MSKLKLLLLGGIFTLFGVFNFSSAGIIGNYDFSCDNTNGCLPSTINLNVCTDNLTINCTTNNGNLGDLFFTFFSEIDTDGWLGGDGLIDGNLTPNFGSDICSISLGYYGENGDFSCTINDNNSGSGGEGGEGGEGGQIISGGFDNFTPAVNGLHETVKQLIPLVVYFGIGALLVTLGFIVIRWLVNWLSKNIISKFKSKRV